MYIQVMQCPGERASACKYLMSFHFKFTDHKNLTTFLVILPLLLGWTRFFLRGKNYVDFIKCDLRPHQTDWRKTMNTILSIGIRNVWYSSIFNCLKTSNYHFISLLSSNYGSYFGLVWFTKYFLQHIMKQSDFRAICSGKWVIPYIFCELFHENLTFFLVIQ